MRSSIISFIFLLGLVFSAAAQNARPQFRPAVLASGPLSLVNRIDAKDLLAKGQKNGAVQFGVVIGPHGDASEAWTYRAIPGSKALEEEVLKRLSGSKFTPPIYNHQPVSVILYGTVIFDAENTPYVKILLNQDPGEIKAANDFIGPQPVIGADSSFVGLHGPPDVPVAIECIVELKIRVDGKGNLLELNVTGEDPPLLGFRQSAEADFKDAKFIPAFRDGDAIDSTSFMSVCYKPVGVNPGGDEQ